MIWREFERCSGEEVNFLGPLLQALFSFPRVWQPASLPVTNKVHGPKDLSAKL